MDQKEQIEKVAHVLSNWEEYNPRITTRGRSHSGLQFVNNKVKEAAKRIVERNWNGRKVVSSMFKMAQYVESELDLKLKWLERYHLARLLMGSLTFAGIYKCVQENPDDSFSPYHSWLLVSAKFSCQSQYDSSAFAITRFSSWRFPVPR